MMSDAADMPESRLASRIRWLLVGLACTVAGVFSLGGWLLLIDAEDAIQDSYLEPLLRQLAAAPKDTVMPRGIVRYWDAGEISETHGWAEAPLKKGLYESKFACPFEKELALKP
jgi:hypothetical protein